MGGSVWIINPDLLTTTIAATEGLPLEDANHAAVQRVEAWLDASIDAYQTIGVETVLSSPKYRRLVDRAHARGFEVRMIYVLLDRAERQVERVAQRVADGGHDVPANKIIERRQRSFEQLAWFMPRVDTCYVFDNSSGEPDLIAAKMARGPVWQFLDWPADLAAALDGRISDLRRR